uniref:Uncharacterized protein n=1 Tax=Pristhesancus plagipennis TaxID=1955184 RepID=A0A2K8JMD9_PRIPG|nr:secreted hypothetical protein [Pristhesancus plagipennis]
MITFSHILGWVSILCCFFLCFSRKKMGLKEMIIRWGNIQGCSLNEEEFPILRPFCFSRFCIILLQDGNKLAERKFGLGSYCLTHIEKFKMHNALHIPPNTQENFFLAKVQV